MRVLVRVAGAGAIAGASCRGRCECRCECGCRCGCDAGAGASARCKCGCWCRCNGGALGGRSENGMMFRSLLYPDFIYFYLSGENPYTKATAAASPHSFRLLRCLSGSQTCTQHSKQKKATSDIGFRGRGGEQKSQSPCIWRLAKAEELLRVARGGLGVPPKRGNTKQSVRTSSKA